MRSGSPRPSILTAFVVESTFLASVGGALGCLIALPANGMTSASGGPNFGEIGFAFRIEAGRHSRWEWGSQS